MQWEPVIGLASGAAPTATFPNCHLLKPVAAQVVWSDPQQNSPLAELCKAVQDEDWERNYEQGFTKINMRAEWSASEERMSTFRYLASSNAASRVLEIGSFCGAGALALAEVIPADGEVRSLELDSFVVDFGRRFQLKSLAGKKITTNVGPAMQALQSLAAEANGHRFKAFDCMQSYFDLLWSTPGLLSERAVVCVDMTLSFDLVVIDADKEGMQSYFDLLWSTPGLLSERAVVCVDMTLFKGQPPTRYVKFGFPHRWHSNSGQAELDTLRAAVQARADLRSFEFGGMLVVTRPEAQP
eukprot:CAMPEP_0183601330 /NCGR_PEP_ID=MMETSP0371-20130417/180391_1 /TAXON_ID=268820 /ORGANISM="Peridinium aciculiferum, Strain PAER-2" /LENGTH=297 /DNA_ID=CAMNT_0025813419 /DNA_START=89 /DNA_END=982 /DNA_ORIENTATION=-